MAIAGLLALYMTACGSGRQIVDSVSASTGSEAATTSSVKALWDTTLNGTDSSEGFFTKVAEKFGAGPVNKNNVVVEYHDDNPSRIYLSSDWYTYLSVSLPQHNPDEYQAYYQMNADTPLKSTIITADTTDCDYAKDPAEANGRQQEALTFFQMLEAKILG